MTQLEDVIFELRAEIKFLKKKKPQKSLYEKKYSQIIKKQHEKILYLSNIIKYLETNKKKDNTEVSIPDDLKDTNLKQQTFLLEKILELNELLKDQNTFKDADTVKVKKELSEKIPDIANTIRKLLNKK